MTKSKNRKITVSRSSLRLTPSKGNYPPGSARRGRPPGTGKKQREAAAAAVAAMMDDDMTVTLDGGTSSRCTNFGIITFSMLRCLPFICVCLFFSSDEQLAVKKLKCKQCKFRASDEAELDTHVNDVHQGAHDVIYKCSECEFTCGYIKDYYKHLKKHFPGPPFKCDNCKYSCYLHWCTKLNFYDIRH